MLKDSDNVKIVFVFLLIVYIDSVKEMGKIIGVLVWIKVVVLNCTSIYCIFYY